MELKSNNSNYRQISTKLIIVGTLLKVSKDRNEYNPIESKNDRRVTC